MKKLLVASILALAVSCGSPSSEKAPAPPKEITEYSIEQFYKNESVSGGSFSNDESRLIISSNESGIFNLYEIDIESGKKNQITFSDKESFFGIDEVPNSSNILYSADKGGNENNHIYLLDKDGNSTDLTPGDKVKTGFNGWSEDKKHMLYMSNKRDPRFFDMYKMDLSNWDSKMIYQNDEGLNIGDVSHNEKIYSISKSITTSENKLFLLFNETGEKIEISTESGTYNGSGFSKDDAFFFYTTDVGKEFTYLVKYEIATGESEVIFEDSWDVMYSYLSENETYRVIGVNEDGKTTLIILDNKTNEKVDFPAIADGDIKGVNIAESEKLMRLVVGSSKSSNDIYMYNFETKTLNRLTNTMSSELDADMLVSAQVVRYKSFDGLEIPAIYYKPLTASADNKTPALVWVHGGPGGQSRVGYFGLIQYLVNHGYAILAVNNRGSSGYGKTFNKMDDLNHGDKDLKDCIWGKKWLQEQDYIDADKIGIIGGSYGGYMTMAAMAFTPDEFKVGVNIFGVTNWLRTLKSIPPHWESFREALYKELGDPTTADSTRLYAISPLFHAENIKSPVMVLQGANDPRVLQVESDEIVAAIYGQILTFLDTYLKGGTPVKQ